MLVSLLSPCHCPGPQQRKVHAACRVQGLRVSRVNRMPVSLVSPCALRQVWHVTRCNAFKLFVMLTLLWLSWRWLRAGVMDVLRASSTCPSGSSWTRQRSWRLPTRGSTCASDVGREGAEESQKTVAALSSRHNCSRVYLRRRTSPAADFFSLVSPHREAVTRLLLWTGHGLIG